jgi:hypothetical protein
MRLLIVNLISTLKRIGADRQMYRGISVEILYVLFLIGLGFLICWGAGELV